MQQNENWKSQLGVILAVTGSAVGLGNFLRFPGQAALHGGGAFMIPYFIAFLILGIPLAWTEWALGRYGGARGYHSVPGIFRCIVKSRWGAYFGTICVLMQILIFSYYIFIESWCLVYAVWYAMSATGVATEQIGTMQLGSPETFGILFGDLVGLGEDGRFFKNMFTSPGMIALIACFAFNFVLIYRGINRGIEWFCKIALPLLLICSLIILVRVLTLGNPTGIEGQSFFDGLGFVWNPSTPEEGFFKKLSNPNAWLAASGQVFFSLSVGFGLIITYASYTKRNDDIALSSLTACTGNSFCEVVFGGLMIVPAAVMFLGSANIKENVATSFALGFQTLPSVFEQMPLGFFFGFLFFFLLLLAAITSSISMLQPSIALIEEGFGLGRKMSVTILCFVQMISTAFVVYFSKGLLALDTFDFWVGNVGVFVSATFQVILFAWILGMRSGMEELERGAMIKIPRFVKYLIKYIAPLFLITIFLFWLKINLPAKIEEIKGEFVARLSIGFMLALGIFLTMVVALALTRWEKQDKDAKEEHF